MDSRDEQIELLKLYIQSQNERLAEKDATIAELRKVVEELRSIRANLEETLEEFRRQFFGIRSEKTKKAAPETEENPIPVQTQVRAHSRKRSPKRSREDLYAGLPVREVKIPLSGEETQCPYCNADLTPIGYTYVREEVRITPAVVERVRILQETGICPECKKDGDGTLVKAKTPPPLFPHSPASASALAYIAFEKTFMGLPYYRQESGLKQLGLNLPRETMANWYISGAEQYLFPIYERLHCLLLERDLLHADETTCQVLREEGKSPESTSYMWIYLTGTDGKPPIVLYDYAPGRGGCYPQEFLKGFEGLLQCDGYQGYLKVEDVILVCCLAHLRRKFYEALPAERKKKIRLQDIHSEEAFPEQEVPGAAEQEGMIPAEVGLIYCNCLFYQEKQLKGLPPETRKQLRQEKEEPIWEAFWKWLDRLEALGGSKLQKAVTYAQNHRETLCNYMLDGRCELSNNAAERCAKSYAIGRKNFLFHTSVAGATASAVTYSIVETAKANNLNVFQYLYLLLLYMPDYKDEPAGIEQLLPWSDFVKEHCSGLIDVENITSENRPALPI